LNDDKAKCGYPKKHEPPTHRQTVEPPNKCESYLFEESKHVKTYFAKRARELSELL
jgi:hypothetical protein